MSSSFEEAALFAEIGKVRGLDEEAMEAARRRQMKLAKPPGSLGKLEELSVQLAGITGKVLNGPMKKRLIVLCADNGVVDEGVASAPRYVTLAQAINMTKGLTGAGVLCAHYGAEIQVVDVGIMAEYDCPKILDRKIVFGTGNIAHEPAMTKETAIRAVMTGIELAGDAAKDGIGIIGVGEMGIGNTTTSAAVLASLTGQPAELVVGRGGGVNDKGFERKKEIVADAVKRFRPDRNDPLDVLAKVGGLDIAAMTGVFLGAAANRLPVVIDGYISAVAALCAFRLCPRAREYMIPSHKSCEAGYAVAMNELSMKPMLMLDMRLGEGSGCPLVFGIVEAACAVMNNMASFESAGIDDGYLEEIRSEERYTDKGETEI